MIIRKEELLKGLKKIGDTLEERGMAEASYTILLRPHGTWKKTETETLERQLDTTIYTDVTVQDAIILKGGYRNGRLRVILRTDDFQSEVVKGKDNDKLPFRIR